MTTSTHQLHATPAGPSCTCGTWTTNATGAAAVVVAFAGHLAGVRG